MDFNRLPLVFIKDLIEYYLNTKDALMLFLAISSVEKVEYLVDFKLCQQLFNFKYFFFFSFFVSISIILVHFFNLEGGVICRNVTI
jgi:hypothetical protein